MPVIIFCCIWYTFERSGKQSFFANDKSIVIVIDQEFHKWNYVAPQRTNWTDSRDTKDISCWNAHPYFECNNTEYKHARDVKKFASSLPSKDLKTWNLQTLTSFKNWLWRYFAWWERPCQPLSVANSAKTKCSLNFLFRNHGRFGALWLPQSKAGFDLSVFVFECYPSGHLQIPIMCSFLWRAKFRADSFATFALMWSPNMQEIFAFFWSGTEIFIATDRNLQFLSSRKHEHKESKSCRIQSQVSNIWSKNAECRVRVSCRTVKKLNFITIVRQNILFVTGSLRSSPKDRCTLPVLG